MLEIEISVSISVDFFKLSFIFSNSVFQHNDTDIGEVHLTSMILSSTNNVFVIPKGVRIW